MTRRPIRVLALLLVGVLLAPPASAGPRGGGEGRFNPEKRERMLRRAHTLMVMELAERLSFDSAATIKLAERLRKFEDQRVALRLENWEAMKTLRAINEGTGTGDAVALTKKVAANRVKLAQVDEAELAEMLVAVPPDQAAKVAVFVGEFTNRLERVARDAARSKRDRRDGAGRDDDED